MSTVTVPISDENLEFLQTWTKANGMTPESYFSAQVESLRRQEGRPIHPALIRATGVIKADVDGRQAYLEHMAKKHS
jgi:hypothetical protein